MKHTPDEYKGIKILIVDDTPENLGVLFDYLNQVGFTVLVAQSGEDALELIGETVPDVILLDILMPGMDGFETCRKIKQMEKKADIPVFFVSSLSDTVDKVKGFEAGGVDYITKPVQHEEMLARISIHLHLHWLQKELEEKNAHLWQEIIERKQAEAKAEAASRAKSEFLANMSHEIRTPMNAIMGFSEILDSRIEDPQLKHYLSLIRSAGRSLLGLINDILDLSKIEAGKMKLEYQPVSARVLFNEIAEIFSQKVAEKHLDFFIETDPFLPESLFLDEIRMRQILFNLVGNAVKFTDSGYIRMAVRILCVIENQNAVDLVFSVEDTGIGIPDDQKERVFGAFEQQAGQSSRYGGTGLGLAITRRLVEMMNGSIAVQSIPGKGSVFTIHLKNIGIAGNIAHMQKEMFTEAIVFDPAVILIADDVPDNLALLRTWLAEYDLNVIEAENGSQALEMAKDHRPDLILMDIKMPGLNGKEVIRILKSDEKTKHIPIIAVTAFAMKESEEELKSVCDGYVKKPVSKNDLFMQLSRFLKSHKKENIPVAAGSESVTAAEKEKTEDCHDGEVFNASPECLDELPELIGILEEKEKIRKKISETMTINDIKNFAYDIWETGKKYRYPVLENWGKNLESQADMFDTDAMSLSLGNFDKIISMIRCLH